jgi:hypothetical protein
LQGFRKEADKRMEERIVYLNRSYIEESEARLSIHDRGFIHGDAA